VRVREKLVEERKANITKKREVRQKCKKERERGRE